MFSDSSAAPATPDQPEFGRVGAGGINTSQPQLTEPGAAVPGLEPDAGGCPPPLNWSDVVQEFVQNGDAWYLDRPGYRLQGRSWGNGPPIYFLNGISGTLELFSLLVYLLREDYRCVLFDYPGTHGSSRESHGLTLDRLVDDLFAVADQIGDQQFNLFATSFGTLVAQAAMLRHPDRIQRAILQGGFASRELSFAERTLIRVWSHMPGRYRHVPFRKMVQQFNHRRWFPPLDPTRWDFLVNNSGQTPAASLARRAAVIRDTSLVPRLGEIKTPVLLVRCEGEAIVSEECHDVMAKGLPNATTEFLHTTGHLPYLTHPNRIAKLVKSFVTPDSSR